MKKLPAYLAALALCAGVYAMLFYSWGKPIDLSEAEHVEVTFYDEYAQDARNGNSFEQFGRLELYSKEAYRTMVIPYFLSYGRENMDRLREHCDGETVFYADIVPYEGENFENHVYQLSDENGNIYITPEQYNALKADYAKKKAAALTAVLLLTAFLMIKKMSWKDFVRFLLHSGKIFAALGCISLATAAIITLLGAVIPDDEELKEYVITFEGCFIEDRRNGYSHEGAMALWSAQMGDVLEIGDFRQYGDMVYRLKEKCDNRTKFRTLAVYFHTTSKSGYSGSHYIIVRLEDEYGTVYFDNSEGYHEHKEFWDWSDFTFFFSLFFGAGLICVIGASLVKQYQKKFHMIPYNE